MNEKAGITWSDIQPIALAPADATAAFAQGSVDAWSIWDPYLALAELKGDARVLVFAKEVHQPNAFVIARADFVENYPLLVTRLNTVFASEGVWANAHHEEVAQAQAAATGVDIEAIREAARPMKAIPVTGEGHLKPPGQRIALAQDLAFSFMYPHLLAQWRRAGAEIVPFSPLKDEAPDAAAVTDGSPGTRWSSLPASPSRPARK